MLFLLSEFQPYALQQGELREVLHRRLLHPPQHQGTLIKKKIKFSSYNKEIQNGAVAKSYMKKGFLIYEEMGKYFPIRSLLDILIYEENSILFFINVENNC